MGARGVNLVMDRGAGCFRIVPSLQADPLIAVGDRDGVMPCVAATPGRCKVGVLGSRVRDRRWMPPKEMRADPMPRDGD